MLRWWGDSTSYAEHAKWYTTNMLCVRTNYYKLGCLLSSPVPAKLCPAYFSAPHATSNRARGESKPAADSWISFGPFASVAHPRTHSISLRSQINTSSLLLAGFCNKHLSECDFATGIPSLQSPSKRNSEKNWTTFRSLCWCMLFFPWQRIPCKCLCSLQIVGSHVQSGMKHT